MDKSMGLSSVLERHNREDEKMLKRYRKAYEDNPCTMTSHQLEGVLKAIKSRVELARNAVSINLWKNNK